MKKYSWLAILVVIAVFVSHIGSVSALFDNGGFEAGDFSGWTKEFFKNYGLTDLDPDPYTYSFDGTSIVRSAGGYDKSIIVSGVTPLSQSDPVVPEVKYPRFGNQSAVVNFNYASNNANVLRQSSVVTAKDVDEADGKIHMRFAYAPIMEDPGHTPDEQPWFYISLKNTSRDIILYETFAYANQPGVPWKTKMVDTFREFVYTDWQVVDIAPGLDDLAIGDTVELEVIAAACELGGHKGWVYVDAFGSEIPGISVVATAPELVNAGTNLTYTYTYRNKGTADAANIIVTATIPANTTFVSVTDGNCTETGGTVTCNFGNLAIDQSGSFDVTVHVNPGATGTIEHGDYSIVADGEPALLGPLVSSTITGDTLYDISVTKSDGVNTVQINDPVSYTITVTNHSALTDVPGVIINDAIPPELINATWVCVPDGGATCTPAGSGNITDTVFLPGSSSVTYTLDAQVGSAASNSVINIVSITPPNLPLTFDANSNNNAALDADFLPVAPTAFVDENPPDGYLNIPYSYFVFEADGYPEPTYAVVSGALPTGLSLDADTGLLSGTPTELGDFQFVVRASNASGSLDSSQITISVVKAATTTTVISSNNFPYYGETVDVTAYVVSAVSGLGSPDGEVQFSLNGALHGSPVALNGSGQATITLDHTDLSVGTHHITASYSGSAVFSASDNTSAPYVQRVYATYTTAVISPSKNPSFYGEDIVFTANIYPYFTNPLVPDGNVQFTLNGSPVGGLIALDENGRAQVTVPYASLTPGSHSMRVDYIGNTNFISSYSTLSQNVNKAATTITFTPSKTELVSGEPFDVLIEAAPVQAGIGTPGGSVTLLVDSSPLAGPVALDANGQAALTDLRLNAASNLALTVQYSGDTYFAADSENFSDPVSVSKADAAFTTFTFSPADVAVSQPVTVNIALEAVSPGSGTPGGEVVISNGSDSCSVNLSAGSGSCELMPGQPGQPDLSAAYAGDANFNPVNAGPIAGPNVSRSLTNTIITGISETDTVVGQAVEVSVAVSAALPDALTPFDAPPPGGSVLVSSGVDECTAVLSGGSGSCTLRPSSVGATDLTATYLGDANYIESASSVTGGPIVSPASVSIVSINYAPENPVAGQPVTVSVTAAVDAPGSGTPTGTIQIGNGTDTCIVTLVNGQGTCELLPSVTGQPDLSAVYVGDENFLPSPDAETPGPAVTQAQTEITLNGSTSAWGNFNPVWTASVSAVAPSEGVPPGQVQFYLDGQPFGEPVNLVNGQAESPSSKDLVRGTDYVITAEYLGTEAYQGSASTELNFRFDLYRYIFPIIFNNYDG